jgi:hypothetical protein
MQMYGLHKTNNQQQTDFKKDKLNQISLQLRKKFNFSKYLKLFEPE